MVDRLDSGQEQFGEAEGFCDRLTNRWTFAIVKLLSQLKMYNAMKQLTTEKLLKHDF